MLIALLACTTPPMDTSGPTDDTDTATALPTPPGPIDSTDAYIRACESLLGPLPALSCDDAEPLAIYVTDASGTREVLDSSELAPNERCDNPTAAGCKWGSRLGVVGDDEVQWVFSCRNYDDDPAFDQVNLVGVRPATGDTCFMSTRHIDNAFEGDLPRPGSAEDLAWFPDRSHWYTFDELAGSPCTECHDNDPWLKNPWVLQTGGFPEGNPLGPFRPVALDALVARNPNWALPDTLVHPDAGACTSCHRLSAGRTCFMAQEASGRARYFRTDATALTYPDNRWMPSFDVEQIATDYPTEADWEAVFGLAADTIEQCCSDSPSPECWAPAE